MSKDQPEQFSVSILTDQKIIVSRFSRLENDQFFHIFPDSVRTLYIHIYIGTPGIWKEPPWHWGGSRQKRLVVEVTVKKVSFHIL